MNETQHFINANNYSIALSKCYCQDLQLGNRLVFSLSITDNHDETITKWFNSDLKYITDLKSKSIDSVLYNILPDYTYRIGSTVAYTSYFEGEFVRYDMKSETLFTALNIVFHALYDCSVLSRKAVSISPKSILIEKEQSTRVHFLFLNDSINNRSEIASMLKMHLELYKSVLYPICVDMIEQIIDVLRGDIFQIHLWEQLSLKCRRLLNIIQGDDIYFINTIPLPASEPRLTDDINDVFCKHHGILFLYTDNTFQAIQEAFGYAHRYRQRYENIAAGDAYAGIDPMIESERFLTNTESKSISHKRAKLIKMCQKNTLIIIDHLGDLSDDYAFLMKLHRADVIIIPDHTLFKDEQNLIDYGLTYLIV